ncbi:MAG: glycosyltransferase [Aurantimonas endophytica]|uniref:glycosyltransferase family 2 protein n=1 Tax=Aurantimonas endophytica TaxID=1522175 RepID=UPI003003104F
MSIIAYNQEDYIADAIEGAIGQDYDNLEVVVADDCSTDATASIIADYARRFPGRVVAVLREKNGGVTRNSNAALRACTGEFIAFQGGDDILLPGKIAAQVAWFADNKRRVLCGHQVEDFYDEPGKAAQLNPARPRSGIGPEGIIRNGSPLPATSVMVRASAVPAGGFNETIPTASDFLFWIDVVADGGEYGFVEGVFTRYRRHPAQVSNRKFDMLSDNERSYRIIADKYPQYRAICQDCIVRHVVYFGGVRHLRTGNKRAARSSFLDAIRQKPFYLKAWLRLAQTI